MFAAPSPLPASLVDLDAHVQCVLDGQSFARVSPRDTRTHSSPLPGTFALLGDEVVVCVDAGAPAPGRGILRARAPLGRPEGARWHVESGRFAGDGFVVLPGDAQAFTIEAGRDRRLSFGHFVSQPFVDDGEVEFVLEQDGEVLWRRRVTHADVEPDGHFDAGFVRLADTAGPTELAFRVTGTFCYGGFTSPVVGPALDGLTPSTALDGRPNVVLFIADTFRADNLEAYRVLSDAPTGLELPALEALVDRSLRFHNSWSASTWTLPSHASMFTSLLPLQHRTLGAGKVLPRQAVVLAEVLREAGYRTAAVTDGVYLLPSFGLAQGFEEFDQISVDGPRPLDRARALLERGDGCPSFLFVHTYYPHSPFEPSEEARRALALEGAPADSDALVREVVAELDALTTLEGYERPDGCAVLERMYRAQVLDFDREFAAFVDAFDAGGWTDDTHLFFTSDHGEAFGDHGHFGHSGHLWESQTRVPLLWSGPGVASGTRHDPVSGIDLAPTMVALAGLAAPEVWRGRDLVEEVDGGRIWASRHWLQIRDEQRIEHHRSFVTDGRAKLHTHEDGAPFAFDLLADPDEERRITAQDPDWPQGLAEVLERELAGVERAALPDVEFVHPSTSTLEALRAMGCLDDE